MQVERLNIQQVEIESHVCGEYAVWLVWSVLISMGSPQKIPAVKMDIK